MTYKSEIVDLTEFTSNGTDTDDLLSGGNIYVAQGGAVVDESGTDNSTPIYCNGYGTAIIDGFVYGYNAVTFAGAVGDVTAIDIGSTGDVSSFGTNSNAAVEVQTGPYNIDNAGTIQAVGVAVDLDWNAVAASGGGSGGGQLVNTGLIESNTSDAIFVADQTNGEANRIFNSGTISGNILQTGSAAILLHNEGKIDGYIGLYEGGSSLIDSGEIDGAAYVNGNINITSTGVIDGSDTNQIALAATSADYDIANAGQIFGGGAGVDLDGSGTLINTGAISANDGYAVVDLSAAGSVGVLYNYGTISGPGSGPGTYDAVHEVNGHSATIFNAGVIDGGSAGTSGSAIYGDSATVVTLHNSGQIDGQVALDAVGSTISNTGHIDGWVTLAGDTNGTADFLNGATGVISTAAAQNAVTIASNTYLISNAGEISTASSGPSSAAGIELDGSGGGAGVLYNSGSIYGDGYGVENLATSGVDYLYNHGTISTLGIAVGDGNGTTGHAVELFNYGTISSPSYAVIANASDQETLINKGDIEGKIDLAAASSVIDNWGTIAGAVDFAAASGDLVNDGVIEGSVTFTGSYDVFNGALGQVTGVVYGSGYYGIFYAGVDKETFDFAAAFPEYIAGGAGPDTFEFAATTLTSATTIVGGSGSDTIQFLNSGTIAASAFNHTSGIAAITLSNLANNNLSIGNALANTANGGVLTINGGLSADTINISAVATTTDHVEVYGGGGADLIKAGAAVDTFGYHAVTDSTGPTYDTINGVNFGHDDFDVSAVVAGGVAGINAAVTTGSLSTATFNADLASAIGSAQLGAGDAVLFTPNAGTLEGQTFLVVDANHVAGYQANADLVINVTGATGTLATTNFV